MREPKREGNERERQREEKRENERERERARMEYGVKNRATESARAACDRQQQQRISK